MPVKIACPKCNSQYRVPEGAVGKTVKCKKCGSAFKANPGQRTQQAQGRGQAGKPKASAQELQKLGLSGLNRQTDIFASGPAAPQGALGNFAEDPGFGDYQTAQQEVEEEEQDEPSGMSSIVNNPYADSVTDRNRKKAKKKRAAGAGADSKEKLSKKPWFLILAIFLPWFLIATIVGIFAPSIGFIIAVVGLVLLFLINFVLTGWYLKCVFEAGEGAELVMFFLVPFYALFFLYNHWPAMRNVFIASCALAVAMIAGFMSLFLGPMIGELIGLGG